MPTKDKRFLVTLFLGFDLILVAWGAVVGQNEMPYWIRLFAINSMGLLIGVSIGGIWAAKKKPE